jgi:hypothetical protein
MLILYTAAWRVLLASTARHPVRCLDYFPLPTPHCPEPAGVQLFSSRRSPLVTDSRAHVTVRRRRRCSGELLKTATRTR